MPMIKTGENAYRILLALAEGDKRFSQLINEVKKASLARELNELVKMRYATRRIIDSKPPSTIYSITKLGRDFLQKQAEGNISKLEVELERLKILMPDRIDQLKKKL